MTLFDLWMDGSEMRIEGGGGTRGMVMLCLVRKCLYILHAEHAVQPPLGRATAAAAETKTSSCEKQAWLASNYCDAYLPPSSKLKEITPRARPLK